MKMQPVITTNPQPDEFTPRCRRGNVNLRGPKRSFSINAAVAASHRLHYRGAGIPAGDFPAANHIVTG